MKHISQRQGGMTALGIFLILVMVGCFVLFGLTAFPLYNEYGIVQSSMQSTIDLPAKKRSSAKDIRKYFLRNVELNSVETFTDYNIKEMVTVKKSKDGKKKYLNVKYDKSNNLFKNIYLTMKIDETLEIPGGKSK
jgi:uncharacterized protein DUF4845